MGTVPEKAREKSEMNVYRPNEERMKTNGKRIQPQKSREKNRTNKGFFSPIFQFGTKMYNCKF